MRTHITTTPASGSNCSNAPTPPPHGHQPQQQQRPHQQQQQRQHHQQRLHHRQPSPPSTSSPQPLLLLSGTRTTFGVCMAWWLLVGVAGIAALPPVIRIGAIFTEDQRDGSAELAFKYAVYRINKDKTILPKTTLIYDIQYVPKDDSFRTTKKVCRQLEHGPGGGSSTGSYGYGSSSSGSGSPLGGVHALFGPTDPFLGAHIQSICEALHLPHIEQRLDFQASNAAAAAAAAAAAGRSHHHHQQQQQQQRGSHDGSAGVGPVPTFSVNLHPTQRHINQAYHDLISYLNWTRLAIVYEDDYGLFKQQDFMKATPTGDGSPSSGGGGGAIPSSAEMYIRQTGPDTYRQVLRDIRQKEIYKLIVDTNPASMKRFFRAILQLQMNDYRYHYMFTTFDIEAFDLEDFKYNSVNITAFRLVDIGSPRVTEILLQMDRFQQHSTGSSVSSSSTSTGSGSSSGASSSITGVLNSSTIVRTEPALMFDSVYTLAAGLMALDPPHQPPAQAPVTKLPASNVSCNLDERPWPAGRHVYAHIAGARLHGLTGPIEFAGGRRTNFKLDLLKLKRERVQKVGEWTPGAGVNVTDPTAFYETNATNITLIVMTRAEKPYVMVREDRNLTGNARFEGFCIDLLKGIAGQIGFQYSIRLVPDNMYGVYDPETKTWNGIVRELMERRADLAVASMTINYARESVIDFTKPFMNLGIGILFKVPTSQPTRLFSFMNPLAVEIWLYVLAAYLLVSFTLFVMARFSPYEWNNPHPCQQESDVVENQFSVSNSFWFITGTFLRQGSGLNPKKSERVQNRIFSFMNPLAVEIWCYIGAAYVLVSLTIWLVARFSPFEWRPADGVQSAACGGGGTARATVLQQQPHHDCMMHHEADDDAEVLQRLLDENATMEGRCASETGPDVCRHLPRGSGARPHDCQMEGMSPLECDVNDDDCDDGLGEEDADNTELLCIENDFTLNNSFWFAIGTLMQQGSDLNPKATSTRIVGGIWWFFTLIIISSYTANLAAFLTVERMITPIENAADLADQTDISYGTLEGGSTMTFFRDSKIGIYQKMWRFMESKRPSVFVRSYEEGIARVLDGNYAFLMESTMIDYAVQRDCNLTQIGGLLDSKGYGIATPKGSPWRDKISLAILELQEKGVIQILYDKWWKNTGDVCNRDEKNKESKANALGVENIGGVFVVLLCGLALAIVVAILEFCWNSKKVAQSDRQSLCAEMAEELRFAVRCHGSRQRPALRRSCAKCSPGTTYVPTVGELGGSAGMGGAMEGMLLEAGGGRGGVGLEAGGGGSSALVRMGAGGGGCGGCGTGAINGQTLLGGDPLTVYHPDCGGLLPIHMIQQQQQQQQQPPQHQSSQHQLQHQHQQHSHMPHQPQHNTSSKYGAVIDPAALLRIT